MQGLFSPLSMKLKHSNPSYEVLLPFRPFPSLATHHHCAFYPQTLRVEILLESWCHFPFLNYVAATFRHEAKHTIAHMTYTTIQTFADADEPHCSPSIQCFTSNVDRSCSPFRPFGGNPPPLYYRSNLRSSIR